MKAPIAVDVEPGSAAEKLRGLRLTAPQMNAPERKALWRAHLGARADELDGCLDRIVETFPLDAAEIALTADALAEEQETSPHELEVQGLGLLPRHGSPFARGSGDAFATSSRLVGARAARGADGDLTPDRHPRP